AYDHRDVEPRWYRTWLERGYFHADAGDRTRPPFSIVLPPPNVTGSLHLGHALTATIQDILIRWKRMSGFNVLWLPGTDHAGIATQMVVEKDLQKTEKKSRHDLGREEFLKRVWKWKEQYGSRIGVQHQALGASLDWERERFTMDEGLSRAVREVFVRLWEEGLIYRAKKLINWCPRCHTALSDLEVNHEENHPGELWSFAYPLADGSGEIVVATTRPETMLGDTAVAVHPDDERWKAVIGKNVRHPVTGREFPVVADAILVDPKFGTGAVKVTPAHDFNDFEVAQRHALPLLGVIGPDGKMTAEAGPFAGMDRFEARKAVKAALAEKGLDRGSKPHLLPLGKCQRCETVLEPLLSDQWYVRIEPLARPAIEAVEQGRTRFIPEGWTNTYMAWMRNIHDWCISRQLWWGHQIPAWYCPSGHVTVSRSVPESCATCGERALHQDEDVLDTWFSSALWPFSTLGWPDRTKELETFYPTSVMETGHDIIFFWVARMMMMGIHFMGEVPFRTVFLHPMVRDEKGQKMSKTKGNVIDPLEITEKYGADALRFTLAALTSAQGRDIKLAKERIEGYRSFANKLWNATRFALMHQAGAPDPARAAELARTPADRWLLARLARAVNATVDALEAYRFDEAAATLYRFCWNELCDWYIEFAKEALYGEDPVKKAGAQAVLAHALDTAYRLLHPMMPFVTEELSQMLGQGFSKGAQPRSLLETRYPERRAVDEEAERSFVTVVGVVEAIRNVRGEMNVPWKTPFHGVEVGGLSEAALASLRSERASVERVGNVDGLVLHEAGRPAGRRPQCAVVVGDGFEVLIPLAGAVDMAAETARVDKEIARITAEAEGLEKRLANPGFVERAPKEVVEESRARVEELGERRRKLLAHRDLMAGVAAPEAPAAPPAPPATAPVAAAVTPAPAAPAAAPAKRVLPKAPPSGTELARKAAAARVEPPARPASKPAAKAKPAPKAVPAKKAAAARKPKPAAKPKPGRKPAPVKKTVPAKKAKPAAKPKLAKKAKVAKKSGPAKKAKAPARKPAPRGRKGR
ncbi:MAG TPA: valine--tRNA ligase, partial [Anaeromyxobacteraceae bacterium]|nr:valine--tRNA ligase [Anaeromyxobacteraceae bacterium]